MADKLFSVGCVMREIGRVVKLQVQTGPLKQGPNREQYQPVNLLEVPILEITARGVVGWQGETTIIDVHHQDHPRATGRKGHTLSFNFTSHYEVIRGRYGEHVFTGCGGDNVVFAAASTITLADLQGELVLEIQTGERGHVLLPTIATPCLSYSRYILNHPAPTPAQLKETLQFLHDGQRGFYADWQGQPVWIRPGDRLLRLI